MIRFYQPPATGTNRSSDFRANALLTILDVSFRSALSPSEISFLKYTVFAMNCARALGT
jgi:hypothetical protein